MAELVIPEDLKELYRTCESGEAHAYFGIKASCARELIERIAAQDAELKALRQKVQEMGKPVTDEELDARLEDAKFNVAEEYGTTWDELCREVCINILRATDVLMDLARTEAYCLVLIASRSGQPQG